MDQTTPKDLIKISTDQTVTTLTTQTSQPKQVILDEDSYTEAISEIIKRDFFPSLITLEAQNDYVDALGTNDPDVIREATIKLTNLTTPANKTPETPLTSRQIGEWDTPASTTSRSTNLFKAHESLEKNYDTNMSLDSFQTKYTSEDNASYPFISSFD
ncbi:8274_t:CDS:2 [Entrophospora sp. SA101]|nr:8274_t:CDS:2 [Entrophospora sp. SA101]CAJ0834638.1 9856_t:CDS:2 [Entrophospora sp. SA101]CAJ0926665.1 3960_t:CDS:2 [Entrophospora sp. SA101]